MEEKTNQTDNNYPEDDGIKHAYGVGYRRGGGRGRGRGLRWMGDTSLMDVRLVEPALLAFLRTKSSHGYGLLEELDKLGLGSIQPSVIYRILRDYEEIGLVESGWDSDETQGPPRRVYSITEAGLAALERAKRSLKDTVDRIEKLLQIIDQK